MHPSVRILFPKAAILLLLAAAGCAGPSEPPPPLWDPDLYQTAAVLPVRMTILTGAEHFQSESAQWSNRIGAAMQEAISTVMRLKGYEVLAPEDLSERLLEEDDLAEAFMALAGAHGFMDEGITLATEEAVRGGALIGEKLGADLLVLAHGNGEYHRIQENLFQGMITGFFSDGRDNHHTQSSFLRTEIFFLDAAAGTRLARIPPRSIPFEKSAIPLTRWVAGILKRVPEKTPPVSEALSPDS